MNKYVDDMNKKVHNRYMWNHSLCRKLLEQKGLTRKFLAQECGLKVRSLTKYLNGYGRPGSAVLKHLAEALGTTVEELERPPKRRAA